MDVVVVVDAVKVVFVVFVVELFLLLKWFQMPGFLVAVVDAVFEHMQIKTYFNPRHPTCLFSDTCFRLERVKIVVYVFYIIVHIYSI